MAKETITSIVAKVYDSLKGVDTDSRANVIRAVLALFGEDAPTDAPRAQMVSQNGASGVRSNGSVSIGDHSLGARAKNWMSSNGVLATQLEEFFHIGNGQVEVIAADIPGSGKRARTQNCYLLSGVGNLLLSDSATVQEVNVISLCRKYACHDLPNHAAARKAVQMSGNKRDGFSLTAPSLREAAALFKGGNQG